MNWLILTLFIYLAVTPFAEARWLSESEASDVLGKYSVEYKVAKNGSWTQTVEYVAKVQGEDAKTSMSLFNIEYNSFTDKVEILEAFTINGKTKIPVEKSAIEDRDKGESKEYDAMKVRSIVFPQVQIGSELHLRYRTTTDKPLIQGRWSTNFVLSPGVFCKELELKIVSELPLHFELNDLQKLLTVQQPDAFHIEAHNAKPTHGWVQGEKDPYFHPKNASSLYISTKTNWNEFFAPLDKDFAAIQAAPLPASLEPWIAKAKLLKSQKAQIYFLMDLMSREFRYFGDWRRHNGGLVPRKLTEIADSRYGDCKDLASLLTAMLRVLKIDAAVALIRRGDNPWGHEPDYILPEVSRFNHAIVQAKIGAETYWLDATNPVSSVEPFPDIAGRPAWILETDHGHFSRTPDALSKDYLHIHNYEYRFSSADAVDLKVDAHYRHMAPYHLATDLYMEPRAQVLNDTMEYFSEGQEVRAFHYSKEPQSTRTLADMDLELELEAGRATFKAGKAAFFVIPDGFLTGAFFETEDRESDVRLATQPYFFTGTRKLKNVKLAQARPAPCEVKSEWMDLKRTITVLPKDLLITQEVDLKKPVITHDEYRSSAFRKLQQATKRCFYRSGILIESRNGTL